MSIIYVLVALIIVLGAISAEGSGGYTRTIVGAQDDELL